MKRLVGLVGSKGLIFYSVVGLALLGACSADKPEDQVNLTTTTLETPVALAKCERNNNKGKTKEGWVVVCTTSPSDNELRWRVRSD